MDGVINITGLLNDLSSWMLGLIPLGGTLAIGYHMLMRHLSTDDGQAAQHSRAARSALFGTIMGAAAAGLIKFFTGYVA